MAASVGARVPVQGERTVSIKQASAATGVHPRTIWNWIATGKVEYVRTAGGAIRIYWVSLWRAHDGKGFPFGFTR